LEYPFSGQNLSKYWFSGQNLLEFLNFGFSGQNVYKFCFFRSKICWNIRFSGQKFEFSGQNFGS